MYMKIISLLVVMFVQISVFAGNIKVYPTPQSIRNTEKEVVLNSDILLIGEGEADTEAVKQLRELIKINGNKKGYRIYIGEKNDKAVKKYMQELKKSASELPDISGAYYLSIDRERMVIAGYDERGTFYALQTLAQLKKGDTLPEVEILDYPGVNYRGVVEGFYGQPWSYEDRINQLMFYGQHKLNVYIYGPKDDPYHSSPDWRKPYPGKEAAQISRLVETSKANKVDFVWAIHPGQDIKWNDEDRLSLLNKFENMYALGVRSFAVFFDDISGEGTDPVRQAELMNYIDDQFVAVKPEVTPLIVCPTEYNKSWANPKPGTYLDILGEKLNKSIMVMWTGDRVMSDITANGLEWVNKRINRPAYVWWNFPVSDYVRDHLLMGPAYGLDTLAQQKMWGFVSNPMEKAEASKIAIACIADYSWFPLAYNFNNSWEHAIQTIMPEAPDAFRTFATHNSDPGANGHKYRRDESVEIKPAIGAFLSEYKKGNIQKNTVDLVANEFEKIKLTPGQLLVTTNNPALIDEIRPWLEQFEVLGQAGITAVELASFDLSGDIEKIWERYNKLLQLEAKKKYIDKNSNQNPYQPGVKTGSLVMQPFVDTVVMIAGDRLYEQLSGHIKPSNTVVTPLLYTNIEQLKNLQLQSDGKSVAITPVLEVIRVQPHEYFGIELPMLTGNIRAAVNLNTASALKWGALEVSKDGKEWERVKTGVKGTDFSAILLDEAVRYIVFANHGTETKEIYLKKFSITSDELGTDRNNPALAQDGDFKTVYVLQPGQSAIFNDPNPVGSTDVSVLLDPHTKINLTVTAINQANKNYELGTINSASTTLNCPLGTRAIQLSSGGSKATNIYEVIWK